MEGGRYLLRGVFQGRSHFEVDRFGLEYEQEVTSVYLWNIKIHYRCWCLRLQRDMWTETSEEVEKSVAHGLLLARDGTFIAVCSWNAGTCNLWI